MKSYINLQYFILIVVVIIVSVVVSNNNYCKTVISSQRLQSLKRDLIDQCHLVASTSSASSAGSTDSQDLLMRKIQQLESHSPFAFDSEDQFRVLDGKWKTIFTTLPLKRLQTLKSLTYSSIPIDIPITVTALYQSVDYAAKTYDNHIDFSLDTMSETGGFLSTIGSILQVKDDSVSSILREGARNRPSRLLIDFSEMFLAPRVDLTQASSVEIRTASDRWKSASLGALCDRLNILPDQSTSKNLKGALTGYSDVTYLDYDGDIRIMRGSGSGIYVLQRL